MAKKGSLTTAHLLVAALVVLVVNAQLSWWIIFFLRENRVQLELKRDKVQLECRLAASRMEGNLKEAERILENFAESRPEEGAPGPEIFESWNRLPLFKECGRRMNTDDVLVLSRPAGGFCFQGRLSSRWRKELLHEVTPMELLPKEAAGQLPSVAAPPPFGGKVITPPAAQWEETLSTYRSRILMMVSEGSFFALMLFVLLALLWRTLRREVALEQQHRNFLSAVTHELKSPLAAMRLSLETVLRGRADSGASVRFLENALQDAERLQELVEKILEVTRFTRKGGGLTRNETCLSDVVVEAVQRFSRRTTAAGANLHSDIDPNIWADVDEEAIAIVISNLLENALKYGGTLPRIDLSLHLVEGEAILDVLDNGRGITDEDIPMVFERFWRSGDEMTRTTQGTGLGLFLVKQIVVAHNGIVEIQSTGPTGTVFRVKLPHARLEEEMK